LFDDRLTRRVVHATVRAGRASRHHRAANRANSDTSALERFAPRRRDTPERDA
jgi:hypothetical protein